MAKLEDLFTASMKQPRRLLDLSKVKIFNDADFFKYMDRVPELKLHPERVNIDDVQIITDLSFTPPGASSSASTSNSGASTTTKPKKYIYEDPLPLSMRSTRLEDLWALDIHWKMLTSDRPPNKLEEGIFERLVELGRFALAARKLEQVALKAIMSSIIGTPATTYLVALGFITTRSKRGAVETRLKICKNCALELCSGAFCKVFHYDSYTRMLMDKDELENQEKEEMAFLKEVSKSGADGSAVPSSSAAAPATAKRENKKKAQAERANKQGRKLKLQLRRTKRKKKRKTKENLEPVSAPDD